MNLNKLINIKNENGKQLLSAKELYLGLGLRKADWSRWYKTNIQDNGFFVENKDWTGVPHSAEGNESMDFAISIDFAKHIAMMARTEKSHEYRNYFIECEKLLTGSYPKMSKELQSILMLDAKTQNIQNRMDSLEDNMPLFNVECKELQSLVRKVGTKALGGYKSPAYSNKSIRSKIYSDIQQQLRREFGIHRYEAIKRCQLKTANEIVNSYKAPFVLVNEIFIANSQVSM